jgi:hypothetical protein
MLGVAAHSRVSYAITAAWVQEQIGHKVARSLSPDWRKKLEDGSFSFIMRDNKKKVITSAELKAKARGWRKFQCFRVGFSSNIHTIISMGRCRWIC